MYEEVISTRKPCCSSLYPVFPNFVSTFRRDSKEERGRCVVTFHFEQRTLKPRMLVCHHVLKNQVSYKRWSHQHMEIELHLSLFPYYLSFLMRQYKWCSGGWLPLVLVSSADKQSSQSWRGREANMETCFFELTIAFFAACPPFKRDVLNFCRLTLGQ